MALLMVRHTTPRVAAGTCYGQTDLDVCDGFQREAESVLAALPTLNNIVSSPLKRCRQLAAFIGAARGIEPAIDARLAEMNFGTWESVPWDSIPRFELDAWAANFSDARPHGGETVRELKTRTEAAIADARAAIGTTLLVTHAGVIRAALAKGDASHHYQTQIDFGGILPLPDEKEPSHE